MNSSVLVVDYQLIVCTVCFLDFNNLSYDNNLVLLDYGKHSQRIFGSRLHGACAQLALGYFARHDSPASHFWVISFLVRDFNTA